MSVIVNDLNFSFGKEKLIENLSFSVSPGQCTVLAGANGTGKSTVLKLICGILKPSSGSIAVDGRLGYVPQGTALLEDATVLENLKFFAGLEKKRLPEKLPFSVSEYGQKKVSELSGGMKKQVSIAAALISEPDIILLDEPCAALDISFRDEMISMVKAWKAQNKAVIYVGHHPEEYREFFDTLIILGKAGKTYSRDKLSPEILSEAEFSRFFKENL